MKHFNEYITETHDIDTIVERLTKGYRYFNGKPRHSKAIRDNGLPFEQEAVIGEYLRDKNGDWNVKLAPYLYKIGAGSQPDARALRESEVYGIIVKFTNLSEGVIKPYRGPTLVFGDTKRAVVQKAEEMSLGDEFVAGDPLTRKLDAIVSPANTIGEMSGGYDLVIRNFYANQKIDVQSKIQQNLLKRPIKLGEARAIKIGGRVPWLIVVPTVLGKVGAGFKSTTPSVDVIEKGTYNFMMEAHRKNIKRVGSVLLGGGVGEMNPMMALKAMVAGYDDAYDDISGN